MQVEIDKKHIFLLYFPFDWMCCGVPRMFGTKSLLLLHCEHLLFDCASVNFWSLADEIYIHVDKDYVLSSNSIHIELQSTTQIIRIVHDNCISLKT